MTEKKVLQHFIDNEEKYSYLPKKIAKISYSFVIVTRNRCPFNQKELYKNPLYWCLESIINQKIMPKEIVLVNDASDLPPIDYTDNLITCFEKLVRNKKIDFIYHKNNKRQNCALARNTAVKYTTTRTLFFIDDDAIARIDSSLAIQLFEILKKKDKRCFILNVPINTRTSHPLILVSKDNLMKIDKIKLDITSNLITRYPLEYFKKPPIIQMENEKIIKPIKMVNFQGGFFIADKKLFLKLGGFEDFGSPVSYGEETALAIDALINKYNIYYLPYNNLAGVHFSYGNQGGRQEYVGKDWLDNTNFDIKRMVKESINPRLNTGIRTSKEFYYYIKIRNLAILLGKISKKLRLEWIKKSQKDFVETNIKTFQDNKGSVDDKKIREKIWQLASQTIDAKSLSIKDFNEIINKYES